MRLVILESPYASADPATVMLHLAYARRALLDSLRRGEAPIASHLLYTQVLDDSIPEQRALGIAAGVAWRLVAHAFVVYEDFGRSPGMLKAIELAERSGIPVEYRRINLSGDS